MTKQIAIRESAVEAPVKRGNRWRVIVARPGQGTSGNYSAEMFQRDAHKIIPKGGQAFINHDDTRNPKDMLGIYPEGSFWSPDDNAVVSELEVFSHWKDFVEEVGPHCGISLYAMGEQDEDGNVTAIHEDRLNGADLVARPGLIGSGLAEKLYESAVKQATNEDHSGARQMEKKETKMEKEQEILDALTGISEALSALVTEKKNADVAEAQIEADKAAVTSAVEKFEAAVVEIDKADLLPAQKESLRKAAKAGEDVAPLIESAKAIKEEAVAALRLGESYGRDFTSSGTEDWTVAGVRF